MQPRVDAALLWGRSTIVGLLAFLLGVVGHVTANGLLPGPGVMALLAAASVLFSVPMLNRQASALRLVVLVVGGQTATHLSLSVAAGHAGDATPAATTPTYLDAFAPTLPVVDGRRVGSLLDAYRGAVEPADSTTPVLPVGHLLNDLAAHAPMMAVHLVAAAVVGLWLAYGERCLWTVIALTGRRLRSVVGTARYVVVPPLRRLVALADRVPETPRSLWFVRPHSRRGPPRLAA